MTILTKEKLQHLNSITHEGKVVVLATDGDGKIWYTVKQDGFEDSYLNQPAESRTGWESWQQLEFPDEPNDISVINKETAELTYKSDTTKFVIKSRYRTKEITAVAPVQLVSALGHIYVFRQSTTNTLLVDRFVLDGMTNTLNRKLEVRFKRSRQKHEPTKNMNKGSNGLVNIDSLDFRDANGLPFYEPTTELCAIGNLQKGWFAVVLVPTIESDVYRWHIFAYNSQTQKVELTTLRASDEGLFEVKDYTIWEDSDKGLLPRSIAGVIKRTLDMGSVTINNGLAATKYDLQQSQMTQSGQEQLLKTATRLMLAVPTTTGTAALSFAIAADGTLAQIDETPEKTIIRSNQREVLLPLNTLDEIKAFGDRTPTPQGIIVGLLEGTKAENAEDLVKVSTNSQAAGLADGDLVKISGTKDYQGLYNTRRIDANTFEISIATGTELGYWEKEEEEEGGLIFDGMITAYEKTADGKLKVSCPNHGLEDGDQVQIYGTQAYNDTYPVKKIDDTHFVIERKWATGEAVNVRLVALKRRGIVFDGVDDYVEIPYSAELNPKQFTVSCWAKVTGGQGTYRSLVTSRDINTSNNTFGYIIYAGENNKWQLWVGNNTQNWTIVTGSDIVLNQWTHIAATFDGSKAKLYINGVFAAEVAANYTGNTARPLRIGTGKTEGTAQQFFSGQIADVLIWNLARTEADIKNSMYLQLTGKETGLVGYWRLGGISEGKVVDFSVNGNDGKVYSDPYVGAMTLNRKLGDNTTDAVKYSNSELFAVSQRAIYEESFEFKVNSPTAVNLAYLNNADGRNLGNKIFTLSYWGKTSRSAEEKKPITTFVQNVFEDVGGGWFRVSANVTIPDGVSMLRSFEINDIKGTWTSLEIRKHRIRLLSDSITEAKYTDSVTLTTLADAYAQLPQQLRTLEFKEQQEFSILKEKRELEDKIALISSGNLSALVAAQQTKVNGLLATKNEKFAIYQNELNSPFNYYCQIKLPTDQMPKQDGKPYLQAQGGTENVVRWSSGQNWQFIDQGNGYYQIKLPNDQMPKQDGKPYLHAQGGTENVVRWSFGQNWQLIKQQRSNNKIETAQSVYNTANESYQLGNTELERLQAVLNANLSQQQAWQTRLTEVNNQLTQVQTELNTANNTVISTLNQVNAQPQTMPQVARDAKGLVTKGAVLGFVQSASRLNAIETCEGNVQLSYFDTQGRMQQTNYDATADANNTAFEQWIPNSLRACLNLTNNNSQIQLANPLYLSDEWTVETWFSFPPNSELIRALTPIELTQKHKLQASDKEAEDYFGRYVAISGNYAIVGSPDEDTGAYNAGAAYIFERNSSGTWTQTAKLQASDKEASDGFGISVAVSGNYAIVGAFLEDTGGGDAGAAYIFERNSSGTWTQLQKLQASDKEAEDYFGFSVGISGNSVIVGSRGEDTGGTYAGAAYIFERNSSGIWTQLQKLQASDKEGYDYFGNSVAISGNYVIVGACLKSTGGTYAGAAYIFERSSSGTWTQAIKLQASDKEVSDKFGISVAISGNYAIVGASEQDTGGSNAGAAYVFERNSSGTWTQFQKLQASDKEASDYFGESVAISGNYAIVGANGEDTGGTDAGAAYIFERNSSGIWTQLQKLQASDKEASDVFGRSVAISGNYAIVGATGEDTGGSDAGAAYVFEPTLNASPQKPTLTLLGSTDNSSPVAIKDGSKLGTRANGIFYDSGYDLNLLTPGWHHLTAVGKGTNQNAATTFYIDGKKVGEAKSFTALEFDGVDDYIEVAAHTNPTTAITVSVWAKSNTENWNAAACLVSKRDAYILSPIQNSKQITFQVYAGGSWRSVSYTPSNISQWHHYAGTFNGQTLKLYIDGVEVASSPAFTTNTAINSDSGCLYIGKDDGSSSYFKGQIAEVSVWNSALLLSQIQTYMAKMLAGAESGLVGYWRFTVNSAPDLSSNQKNGTFQGQPQAAYLMAKATSSIEVIGNSKTGSQHFGKISELRVWNVALKDEEILVNSKTLLSGNEPGLVAYYPMNEATGTTVRDNTGSGNNGTVVGTWWGCNAPIGKLENTALQFDGINDHISLPNLNPDFSQGLTIEAWVWYDSFQNFSRIIDLGNGSPSDNIIFYNLSTTNTLKCSVYRGTTEQALEAPGVLETGKWLHLAITINASGNAKIYKNGQEIKTGTVNPPTNTNRTRNYIGKSNWSSDGYFKGKISDVRIWKVARTQAEIQTNMSSRLTGTETNLVAYYRLDEITTEGTTKKVLDRTANNYHGTVTEAVVTNDSMLPVVGATPVKDALVSAEYSTITLTPNGKVAIMRRFFAYPDRNAAILLPDKRVEQLELKWIGNAQFAPTLLGYMEGAPPVPTENLTLSDDYNAASSVELNMSEDVAFSWNRSQDSGLGAAVDIFMGGDTEMNAGLGITTKLAAMRAGFKGNLDFSYQFQNQSNITSSSSLSMTDKLELRGTPETTPKFPHLGNRFIPKNVGYALVVSALADVFITRLARSGKMVGYQVQPVDGIPPDVNTITFLMNPAYTMSGSLDGLTGSSATSERFFKHVPQMRAQYGSLYPASYYRLQEAYNLKKAIEKEDKRRESYFDNFDVRTIDETSLARNIDSGDAPTTIGVEREEDKASTTMTEEEKKKAEEQKAAQIKAESAGLVKQQSAATEAKKAEIQSKIDDQDQRVQAQTSFASWQKRMEDIQIKAGKRNIVNTYVWDADGGLRTEAQSFANTVEHTIGGSFILNAGLGFEGKFAAFAAVELTAQATVNMTQTMSKTESRSKGIELNVDLSGVEFRGITNYKDLPILPGEKVDRYRFMSFYLEGTTQNFQDFFSYVVDPEWLASNDEEARALRQTKAGKPNKTWRVLHRVTYVERPALMGFGRDLRQVGDTDQATQEILDYFTQLEVRHQELKTENLNLKNQIIAVQKQLVDSTQELQSKLDQILLKINPH